MVEAYAEQFRIPEVNLVEQLADSILVRENFLLLLCKIFLFFLLVDEELFLFFLLVDEELVGLQHL